MYRARVRGSGSLLGRARRAVGPRCGFARLDSRAVARADPTYVDQNDLDPADYAHSKSAKKIVDAERGKAELVAWSRSHAEVEHQAAVDEARRGLKTGF